MFEAVNFFPKANKLNLAEKIIKRVKGKLCNDHESNWQTKNDEPNTLGKDDHMSDISVTTENH